MPRYATIDEIIRSDDPKRRTATLDEITDKIASATNVGQTWVQEDINTGAVDLSNYMHQAAARIQQYQQARSDLGEDRLTANEQVAIVDAYRQMAGLQPEGYYMTKEGAAVPRDRLAEIRRKRTEDDAWANFKANLSSATLQNLAGIRAAQARISDVLGITDNASTEIARESNEITRILQPAGGKSGFAGQAVGNVMNLFLAAGQAPVMFATSTAGHTFLDVAQRRINGQDISPYTEWTAAISNATIEYALESFGQAVARRAGAKLVGRIGDLRNAITSNGIRGGVRAAASVLVKHGLEQTGMALEGAAEEGITEILQNTVRRLSYADEQKILGGVGGAALQGAVMPVLAAGPMAAIQYGRGGRPPSLPFIPPSPAAGDQTLSLNRPLTRLANVERALRSEETLPETLKRSLPAEADIPDVNENSTVGEVDLIDKWIGDRQLAETKADIEARNHRRELEGLLRDGETSDQIDAAIAVYIDMKENSDSYTAENIQQLTPEQRVLVEQAQSLSPEQQAFAEQIIAENKALGISAMEAGIIQNFKENYSARIWRKGEFPGRKKARFTISTPRARERTLPSLIEGWADGMELEVPGALEAQMLAKQQITQVIHDRNLVTLGLKAKIFSQTRTDEHTHRIKHPNFAKWVWTGKVGPEIEAAAEGEEAKLAKVYGKDVFLDADGNLFKRSGIYTDKNTARFLNNALGSSALYSIPGVGTVTKYNSIIKQMILTAALFHHQAYLRSFMLASRGANPRKGYREGRAAIENFIPEVQELVHEGLTIGKILDFDPAIQRESTKVGEIIDKVPMASDVRRALRALSKANTNFLFGKLGPYLKVQAALLEYRHQLQKNERKILDGKLARKDIAKNVSNMINDDFGGLNLQRMGRNPTAQHILRLVTLAPDWTESNVRTMVKAFKRGHEGSVYRAMWGRVFAKGIGATILFNLLMSATPFLPFGPDDEKDFWERYKAAWEAGNLRWLDVDITPLYRKFGGEKGKRKYFSLVGHFRDPLKFLIYPGRSAKNKSSVLGRMALDSLTGTDWKGREFTSIGELMRNGEAVKPIPFGGGPIGPLQFPSFIIKQAEQSTPIQAQVAIQRMRGEIDTFDMITRGAGILMGRTEPPKRKKRPRRTRQQRRK